MPSVLHSISKLLRPKLVLLVVTTCLGITVAEDRTVMIPLVADSRSPYATEWRFSMDYPDAGWNQLEFADDAWLSGKGGFGSGPVGAKIVNDWSVADIWLRKTFEVTSTDFESIILSLQHDDDVEVYLNGTLIFTEGFVENKFFDVTLTDEGKSALKAGKNVLAVHCHNNVGPGYIDAGLSGTKTMQATTIMTDARTLSGGETWKYTTTFPDGGNWYDSGYVDSLWTPGFSGFGSPDFASFVGTGWTSSDIWLRKHVTIDKTYTDYLISFLHDDDMDLYVNGKLILDLPGSEAAFKEMTWEAAKSGFVKGDNVIALHCVNAGGGPQFIDIGVVGLVRPVTVGNRSSRDARTVASSGFPRVLYTGHDMTLDLAGFSTTKDAILEVHRLDGSLLTTLRPEGKQTLVVPAHLGTGTFRYLWRSPSGSAQGLLITLP